MTKEIVMIDGNLIKIKNNIFGKRITCRVCEDRDRWVKYKFSFSKVEQVIQAYYSFLFSSSNQIRFTGKDRDIHFLNERYRKGIQIGCMFFSDETVHLIHSEIL